ncbi:Hypothetical protein POVR1_LOCUS398 [uncultured virus]|nr:Hypothetical protein POVR1_LOCUS398 [uncultured virus]
MDEPSQQTKTRQEIESELIEVIREHYRTCDGKPTPLRALKQHYGKGFKFQSLGLGNYGGWMQQNSHHFRKEKTEARCVEKIDRATVTEQQLLDTIVLYFSHSDMYCHRKHVLVHIRELHGNGPFGQFGFGSFKEFLERNNLDMGIARRQDFRSEAEWKKWTGRRG